MSDPIFKNCILYLIGFPGTGKYTIGKQISEQHSSFRLVDNHLINNPIFSLLERGTKTIPEQAWEYIDTIYDAVIDTIKTLSPTDYSFIFTNVLSNEDPEDQIFYDRLSDLAHKRKAHFIPVRLHCTIGEAKKRLIAPERAERFKLTRPDILEHITDTKTLLTISHPHLLDLDVSDKTIDQSVKEILSHIKQIKGM